MAKKKNLTCPECGFEASKSFGLTHHMKKCCPEQRFLQTKVSMTIEFTVGEDFSKLGAIDLFKSCWGPWKNFGGRASLKSASIDYAEVEPRGKSILEKKKEKQALVNKDRQEAAKEIRQVIDASLGADLIKKRWKKVYTVARHWPRKLEWEFRPRYTKKGPEYPEVRIEYNPTSTTLLIKRKGGAKGWDWGPPKRIRLADPNCFKQIRKACLGDDA